MTWNKKRITPVLAALVILSALITVGAAHSITNITLTPPSLACLAFNDTVDVTFNYSTNETGGVLIFVRPFTGGSLTPNYGAHGSPLYPVGDGNGTGWFTIMSGTVKVDQLRFRMYNANLSEVLLEFFIPVQYCFGECTRIEIEKRINGKDYVTALPGDMLEVTLWINNCGCVNLTNISVRDYLPLKKFNAGLSYTYISEPYGLEISSISSPENLISSHIVWDNLTQFEPLQPGENFTITFEAKVDDLAKGAYENCATAWGNYTIQGAIGGTVEDTDCATVFVPPPVPILTPIGLIALVSLLSVIAAVTIVRKRR